MASTLATIRAELAENILTIIPAGFQVSPYMIANPTPPSIEIVREDSEFDKAMGHGQHDWRFIARAYIGLATDQGSAVVLDTLVDPASATSLKTALESSPTLDGAIDDMHVTAVSGERIYQRAGGPEYLGCEWAITVVASGR